MRLTDRLAADLDGAFEAFVRAHQDAVYSAALRLTLRPADAQDAAQDVFVRAYKALSTWEPERIRSLEAKPWLARITLNVVRNRARSNGRRPETVPLSADVAGTDATDAVADVMADADDVLGRLAALPDKYRAPVVLRHAYGLSYEEVADVLGRPVGTVKAQVSRALQTLKESS